MVGMKLGRSRSSQPTGRFELYQAMTPITPAAKAPMP